MPDSKTQDVLPSRRYKKYYTYIEPIVGDPVIRGYFTLVASLLLVAFFVIFALSPTFSTIVGLVRKIEDQKKVLAALDTKISNLILAQENYSQIEPDLPLLTAALPAKPEPQVILEGVLASASESGVTVTSFQIADVYLSGINPDAKATPVESPSSQKDKNALTSLGIPTVGFTVSVRGTDSEIRDFAGKLASLPRIISLSVLSIGKDNSVSGTSGSLVSDISGVAFYVH